MKNQKKFYLIYQIRNTINGKFYIGKHETNQLDDKYMGSGKHLNNAKRKYGLKNFVMTILCYLHNEEEMNLLERMVVTPEFCAREDTYNINVGGDGGWSYMNQLRSENEELKSKQLKNWVHGPREYCHTPEFSTAVSYGLKLAYAKDPTKHGTTGKHWKSEIASQNMRDPKINRMIGSIWIYNCQTLDVKIQPKDQPIPNGWCKGRKPPKPDTRNKNASAFGHRWINNGEKNLFVKDEHIENFLQHGWKLGRIKHNIEMQT